MQCFHPQRYISHILNMLTIFQIVLVLQMFSLSARHTLFSIHFNISWKLRYREVQVLYLYLWQSCFKETFLRLCDKVSWILNTWDRQFFTVNIKWVKPGVIWKIYICNALTWEDRKSNICHLNVGWPTAIFIMQEDGEYTLYTLRTSIWQDSP